MYYLIVMVNDKFPWKNETEFYDLHSKYIFGNFAFYHTSIIGKTKEDFLLYIIENAKIHKNSKVLDLGCGSGYVVDSLNKLNINSIGISTSTRCIEQCKLNYPNSKFFTANMENFKPHSKKTHILALESLSYSNIEETFKTTFNNLEKGGIFYVKDILFVNLKDDLALKNKISFEDYWKFHLYTLSEIIDIAIDIGFKVLSVKNISTISNNKMFWESRIFHKIKYNILYPEIEFINPYELVFIKF